MDQVKAAKVTIAIEGLIDAKVELLRTQIGGGNTWDDEMNVDQRKDILTATLEESDGKDIQG